MRKFKMFNFNDGQILSFNDVDNYFNQDSENSTNNNNDIFQLICYKNLSGRIIVFEDISECESYQVKDYTYPIYNPDDKSIVNENYPIYNLDNKSIVNERFIRYKLFTYYRHKNNLKSYTLNINGYFIAEDQSASNAVKNNPIIQNLINNGSLVECNLSEAKEYYQEFKKDSYVEDNI